MSRLEKEALVHRDSFSGKQLNVTSFITKSLLSCIGKMDPLLAFKNTNIEIITATLIMIIAS